LFLPLCTVLPGLAFAKGLPPSYQVFYRTDFAKGLDTCLGRQPGFSIVDAPGGGTGKVLKIEAEKGRVRSASLNFSRCMRLRSGRDYMVTWSTYIPADYINDKGQPEEIVAIRQGAGEGPSPFRLLIRDGEYEAWLGNGRVTKRFDLGPFGQMGRKSGDKGYWIRWALHYRPDATGKESVSDLYKNDVLVMTAGGVPNAYADDNAAYLQAGLEKDWQDSLVSRRAVYFSDVTIGAKP
jgi:hypothetical protein